jgi:rhodanese-related sulfurtransferase
VAELAAGRARGDGIIVVDVRTPEEFAEAHVEGAVHVPGEQIASAIATFRPRTARIVTVCTKGGGRSQAAANALCDLGVDAAFLEGGTIAWLAANPWS